MTWVKLTKLSGKPDSHIGPGYWVKGILATKGIEVGQVIFLDYQISTSLGQHFDWFSTTEVQEIEGALSDEGKCMVVKTKNSNWKVEVIK